MTPDLGTTNMWLAVLTVASVGQCLLLLVALAVAYRAFRRAEGALEQLEQRHLVPISERATVLMEDLQDITARARRVDAVVRARLDDMETAVHTARHAVRNRVWPIVGLARAVRAGVQCLVDNGSGTRDPHRPGRGTDPRIA